MASIRALIYTLVMLAFSSNTLAQQDHTVVTFKTDAGDIVVELFDDKAPKTVAHIVNKINRYFYDGVIFHRVIEGFVIQTGGYTYDLYQKDPGDTVENESDNGLKNRRGTLAMARVADPDSARAQFFINLGNNHHLDSKGKKPGYTVFGQVIEGMEVVDTIADGEVSEDDILDDLPLHPIRILTARVNETP